MRLAGKAALITGAGGPMGYAIAMKFAKEGARLVLTDISGTRLAHSVDAIAHAHPQCEIAQHRANATDATEAAGVADLALDRYGQVDILINVVGGIRSKQLYTPFLEMTEAQWDDTFALNLKPGFHLIKRLAPGMIARAYGKIVNISSIVFAGEAGQCDYAAAKAAVASWTRSLAAEFAPHVNVNCIAPGVIRTTVTERLEPADASRLTAASFLKRFGEAREIADAASFLASDEASFITGEIMAVSGGNHPSL